MLLPQLSIEKTNYIIKQLLTIEVLDMTLISTTEYQYWPRLSPRSISVFSGGYHVLLPNLISPRSILVFSGGYHIISNTSIVNNCLSYDVAVVQWLTS